MPIIYLSPSTQEYNLFYDGNGSEEYYMNLVADAMEPYLTASGIEYVRNTPDMTAASSIRASNAGNFDLHLALHSNAAPPNLSGQLRGSDAYYYPYSERSRRLADIIVANLKAIYLRHHNIQQHDSNFIFILQIFIQCLCSVQRNNRLKAFLFGIAG